MDSVSLQKAQFCGQIISTAPPGFTREQCGVFMPDYCKSNSYANDSCIGYFQKNKLNITTDLENFCKNKTTSKDDKIRKACACHFPKEFYEKYMLERVGNITDENVKQALLRHASSGPKCSYPDCMNAQGIPLFNEPVCPDTPLQICINNFNTSAGGSIQGSKIDSTQLNQCVQNTGSGSVNVRQGNVPPQREDTTGITKSVVFLMIAVFFMLITIVLGIAFQNMIVIVVFSIITLSLLLASFLTRQKTVSAVTQTQTKGKSTVTIARSTARPSTVVFKNEKSNMCLDVTDVTSYSKVVETPCNKLPTQKFIIEPTNERILVNSLPSLAIDDILTKIPYQQKLQIYENLPNNPNQSFVYNKNTKQIENPSKNMCMTRGNDGYYYLDTCKDVVEQKFDLV